VTTSVRREGRAQRGAGGRAIVYALLVLATAVTLFPIAWMATVSIRPNVEVMKMPPQWIPSVVTWAAYAQVLGSARYLRTFANSYAIALTVPLLSLAVGALAAYPLSRFRFRGQRLVMTFLIVTQMFPLVLLCIPYFRVMVRLGLYDTLTSLVLVYTSFTLPFCILMLRAYFIEVPRELEEAAMVDGSSRVGAFFRILLPLVAPGLVATSVFVFITSWNEFIFAYVLLNDQSKQTVTVWLSEFYGTSRQVDWGGLMAGSILAAIPVLIFFVFVQRKIAFGLTSGAVKG